ncbi:enhancer of mRNA decapping [Microsporum ferrugineum]
MASEFIGCTVLVTLKTPPNCRVEGEVVDVVGTRLSLQNAHLLWNGQHFPLYHIDGPRIADLEISSQPAPQASSHPRNERIDDNGYHPSQHGQQQHPTVSIQPESVSRTAGPSSFVDPAILSFKRPSRLGTPNEVEPANVTAHPISTSPVMLGGSEVTTSAHINQMGHHSRLPATLNAPFSDLELNKQEVPPSTRGNIIEEQELEQTPIPCDGRRGGGGGSTAAQLKNVGKRGKRSNKWKPGKDGGETTDMAATELLVSATNNNNNNGKKGTAGKGWRQTAFIEPIDTSPTANKSKSRASRKSRAHKEDLNGWATEEATDIQELGDFDFESNLSKFDKRRVFDEIRNDDMTPLEDRLASFNRRPKPGTNGGKNLHYTENVLDSTSQPQAPQWNSEAGETDNDYTLNGRTSSRNRSMASRKGSGVLASTPSSAQFTILGRSHLSTRTASPQPIKNMKHSASSMTGSSGSSVGSLHMITTGRRCPSISPLQMVEIEQLAISELGLTEDIVTENAGRGIAEGAISLATGLRVPSIIIVFVGNHRTGARTVASARHLRNRGYRVSLCILGNDRGNEFTDGFQKQVDVFQKAGGHVMRWEDLSARLSTGDYKPKLVIDALFGMHVAFEDLRTDDQAIAFEIISWVNRSNVDILSVDIPSGMSAVTGEATVSQGSQLAVSSQFVICLGAPKTGLVTALSSREGESWQIAVADVGISPVAWRKYGTRRRHGVEFGNAWVVPLRFQLPTP